MKKILMQITLAVGLLFSQLPTHAIIGSLTEFDAQPWHAAVYYNGVFTGSAAILCNDYVVTSASMVNGRNPALFTIRVGSNDRCNGNYTTYSIASYTMHPNYSSSTLTDDIAVMQTATSMTFSSTVHKIDFPCSPSIVPGMCIEMSGWGLTSASGAVVCNLRSAPNTVLSNAQAATFYPGITANQVAVYNGKYGICSGDLGSPMTAMIGGQPTLLGVASFSFAGCAVTFPSFYTRISPYVGWIASVTGCSCGQGTGPKRKAPGTGMIETDPDADPSQARISIAELEVEVLEVNMYPNPANDHVEIDVDLPGTLGENEIIEMVIYDMTGKVVHHTESMDETFRVDVSTLNPGIYLVNTKVAGEMVKQKLVIE